MKVVDMARELNDGTYQTPAQALQKAIKAVKEDELWKDCKKILILALEENDQYYNVGFMQAGMNMGECISLCEVAKTVFLKEMKYIPDD